MLGAAPERDATLREIARKATQKIVLLPPEKLLEPLLRLEAPRFKFHVEGAEIDIVIAFAPVDSGHGQAAFIPPRDVVFFVLPPQQRIERLVNGGTAGRRELKKLILTEFPSVMRSIASDIVHELTHAIDILMRGMQIPPLHDPEKTMDEDAQRLYVSSPAEFNAFYQQTLYELEKELQRMSKTRRAALSFNAFVALMQQTQTFRERSRHLDEKYRRKWFSRAYQAYEHFQKLSAV
jgi:hypothetical protein